MGMHGAMKPGGRGMPRLLKAAVGRVKDQGRSYAAVGARRLSPLLHFGVAHVARSLGYFN